MFCLFRKFVFVVGFCRFYDMLVLMLVMLFMLMFDSVLC